MIQPGQSNIKEYKDEKRFIYDGIVDTPYLEDQSNYLPTRFKLDIQLMPGAYAVLFHSIQLMLDSSFKNIEGTDHNTVKAVEAAFKKISADFHAYITKKPD